MDIRLLTNGDIQEAIGLVDRTFRNDDRPSLAVSSPKVFSGSLGQAVGGYVEGKLVSFAGLVPSIVRVGEARLLVYSYGAVCTDPDFRGRGCASLILDYAKRHIDKAGASLLLVSGNRSLYTDAGCHRFGAFRKHTLSVDGAEAFASRLAPGVRCRAADLADWFRLRELSAGIDVRYERSVWDLADLHAAAAVTSMQRMEQTTLIAERNGKAVAFCVLALKRDGVDYGARNSYVLEWAGPAVDVCAIVQYALANGLADKLDITVGWQEREMERLLDGIGTAADEDNSGTVHIVSPARLFEQLRPNWERTAGAGGEVPTVRGRPDGSWSVAIGSRESEALDLASLTALLFDHEPEGPASDREWRDAAARFLPVPFPYTKGLNYV
ncbi:GNAT family N-acetyltransferase [Paenibacillus mesophilus]|uniref:GNAT family N-acetyltransferase n=1 Tax=Paenibacillus mesophilus TaxID=2582849 RepID=UPI00110E78A0|nr:GNAT family N-acetyltransferase [Paenibacillus mesophilus]TMV48149.1 GNAT family N-acetyltransferase [Paenibacillus mesophilus]